MAGFMRNVDEGVEMVQATESHPHAPMPSAHGRIESRNDDFRPLATDVGSDNVNEADPEPLSPSRLQFGVPWPGEDDRASFRMDLAGRWARENLEQWKLEHLGWKWFDWVYEFFPITKVVRYYDWRRCLANDLIAGLTVGAMLVPQGMSYAKLAGLPPVWGLYGGFIPILLYACLGSSPQLGVGPVAVTSMLLGSGLPLVIDSAVQANPAAPADPLAQLEYNQAAVQVAFLVGLMYTAFGVFNLGWVMNFLSHSVISGFMTGASIIIGLGQVKYIFGYKKFPKADPIHQQLGNLFSPDWTPHFVWQEFVLGIMCIFTMIAIRKIAEIKRLGSWKTVFRFAGYFTPLVLVIMTTAVMASKSAWHNISIVGAIPNGLPHATTSWFFPMKNFSKKITLAVVVCFIDMLESISIARALALANKYELKPTTELRALGIVNIIGPCFCSYTTTGSFSRSSVMNATGAKTQVAGFVTSMVIMVVLLAATSLFKTLPNSVMAAVIIAAMPGLFNYQEFFYLWKVNKFDWLVFTVAFLGTIFLGVELGLAISMGLSLVIVVSYSAFPSIVLLGHLPGTNVYRNIKLFPEAKEVDGFLIIRLDSPLYFANVNPLRSFIEQALKQRIRDHRHTRFLVLDLGAVSTIDGTATHFLKSLVEEYKRKDIKVIFVQPNKSIISMLARTGLAEMVGRKFVGMHMHDILTFAATLPESSTADDDDDSEPPVTSSVSTSTVVQPDKWAVNQALQMEAV